MHQAFEAREVVVEVGEARPGRRREHEVAGTGERDTGRERRVEITGRPVQRGQRLGEIGPVDLLDVRLDAGERGPDLAVRPGGPHLHRYDTGGRREHQLAGADPLGQREGRRHGGVPAERHLGLRTEVPDAVRPLTLPRGHERRLRVPEPRGDGEHGLVVHPGGVEHDTGGIPTAGITGERGIPQHLGPHRTRRHASANTGPGRGYSLAGQPP